MNVGERIKQRREWLGMSVDRLAEKIGKDRSTIYRYEAKQIEKLPIEILDPVAEALNTTPEYLMGWTDSPERQLIKESQLSSEESDILTKFRALPEWMQRLAHENIDALYREKQEFDRMNAEKEA